MSTPRSPQPFNLANLFGVSRRAAKLETGRLITAADDANRRRDWTSARLGYAQALKLNPTLDHIWVQYGHALKETGDLAEAETAYRRALQLHSNKADTFLQLGHALKLQNKLDAASDAYRRAYELDPASEPTRQEVMGDSVGLDVQSVEQWRTLSWYDTFNVPEFRAMYPTLASDKRTKDELVGAFILQGIDELAAISFSLAFDPDFYRARNPETAFYSDSDAYRHWLFTGHAEGRPGSAQQAQIAATGLDEFPANFDIERYRTDVQQKEGVTLGTATDAIEHLLDRGYESGQFIGTTSGHPGEIYNAIATYLLSKDRPEAAIEALTRAISFDPTNAVLHHKLGDFYFNANKVKKAEESYRRALAAGSRSIWTVLHLINFLLERNDYPAAHALLHSAHAGFAGERIWRNQIDKVIEEDFRCTSDESVSLLRLHLYDEADSLLDACLERVEAAYRDLDGLPGWIGAAAEGHVVMFSLMTVPQCRHYRVEQRCEQFEHAGIPYKLFGGDQPLQARAALLGARALLIYREPAFPETIRLILHARAMGIPVLYEIDDLIFDKRYYPDEFQHYEGQISYEGYVGLLYGIGLYRYAIKLSDEGIASTTALQGHLAPLVRNKRCHVIPNALDSRNIPFLSITQSVKKKEDETYIFYGSGARAHNRNFNECIAPSLAELLASRPNVKLVIVGYLDLDPVLAPFGDQIIRIQFIGDIQEYWSLLSRMDINIAVLVPGEMNDCKSEIKWLEAAAAGVPSVVSASATYREVLRSDENAVLITSNSQWRDALFKLVDDPRRRQVVGENARRHAQTNYSIETLVRSVTAIFEPPAAVPAVTPVPRRKAKLRLLLAAVLFPPQTFGGATRVVRDNVDSFLDRFGNVLDVAVFATDFDAPVGSTRVDNYRGIPVFRYSPPLGAGAEERYNDEGSAKAFQDVIEAWQPSLVHFHCIQYLTASICAAAHEAGIPYLVTIHDGWWLSRHQFFVDEDFALRIPSNRTLATDMPAKEMLAEMSRASYLATRLRQASAVLAVSKSFADIYAGCGIAGVQAIPNGISDMFLTQTRRPAHPGGRVRIGHIGGTALHKGLHLFRAALLAGGFSNIEAVVMDHTKESAYRQTMSWGTTPVTLVGKIAQKDMVEFYQDLDVLIVPSIWPESYGLVSREALACGLWVIASKLGAMGEDVVEGKNGFLVDVEDSRNIIEVLTRIDRKPGSFLSPPTYTVPMRPATKQVDELVELYKTLHEKAEAQDSDGAKVLPRKRH